MLKILFISIRFYTWRGVLTIFSFSDCFKKLIKIYMKCQFWSLAQKSEWKHLYNKVKSVWISRHVFTKLSITQHLLMGGTRISALAIFIGDVKQIFVYKRIPSTKCLNLPERGGRYGWKHDTIDSKVYNSACHFISFGANICIFLA